MQMVSFATAGGLHAIPVLAVEEFFRPVPVTPIPLADPRVAGLMNLRGKSATVLNLRNCFSTPSGTPAANPKMILLETSEHLTPQAREIGLRAFSEPVVLIVDRIIDIVNVDLESLQSRPAHVVERFVSGVVRHDDDYICLLDIVVLIDDILNPQV